MPSQVLELKPAVSVASALKIVQAPLKIPAWSVVLLVAMAGVYGYFSGRQNPLHHYVPYVGYPLVLDTTTGKSCYSSAPRPSGDGMFAAATDPNGTLPNSGAPTGPAIPMCGK